MRVVVLRSLIGLKAVSCLLYCAIGAATSVGLPTISGPIPVSDESPMYGAADVPGAAMSPNLAAQGYVEEEYFVSGVANVYGYDEQQRLVVEQSGIAYTTSLIVRRPQDPAKFSGNIQFEAMHPMWGLTPTWSAAYKFILRRGDIYVALAIGADPTTRQYAAGDPPHALPQVLKWFDAKRYAAIRWPDDDGIRWDVIMQVAHLLRSNAPSNPLANYAIDHIYASGWAYTGSLWRTFINEGFHERARSHGHFLFDGYLIGISTSSFIGGYLPINSSTPVLAEDSPRRTLQPRGVPVIELMSESEALITRGARLPDSDDANQRYRLYEVPGISHGDGLLEGEGALGPLALQFRHRGYRGGGRGLAPSGCDLRPSDVPMRDLAVGALANLDRWVRDNQSPPSAERIAIDPSAPRTVKDAYGNTLGGVRSAFLDVPLAKYAAYQGDDKPECRSGGRYFAISRQPFDKGRLQTLYKNKEEYLAKFKANLDRLVHDRWILQPEADREFAAARSAAKAAFD
jgi:hypothetical protein